MGALHPLNQLKISYAEMSRNSLLILNQHVKIQSKSVVETVFKTEFDNQNNYSNYNIKKLISKRWQTLYL